MKQSHARNEVTGLESGIKNQDTVAMRIAQGIGGRGSSSASSYCRRRGWASSASGAASVDRTVSLIIQPHFVAVVCQSDAWLIAGYRNTTSGHLGLQHTSAQSTFRYQSSNNAFFFGGEAETAAAYCTGQIRRRRGTRSGPFVAFASERIP